MNRRRKGGMASIFLRANDVAAALKVTAGDGNMSGHKRKP